MPDDMFFVSDKRALRRGRRIAARTETCRACLVWLKDAPDMRYCGVALDVSPHGMRIRMMEALPERATIFVQMMRDEDFEVPLTTPIEGNVARSEPEADGFIDHGVKLIRERMTRGLARPAPAASRPQAAARVPRPYTLDVTIGDRGQSRSRR